MLILRRPTIDDLDQIAAYRAAFLARGDDLAGTSALGEYEDPADWLARVDSLRRPETCPGHLVPSTTLLCVREEDGRLVGMIDIRHRLNDYLAQFGGHIGYSVHPAERRKGYAAQMLRLALGEAASLGLERVLVTCDQDNEASRRTILHNGGVLESEVPEGEGELVQRYWIEVAHG